MFVLLCFASVVLSLVSILMSIKGFPPFPAKMWRETLFTFDMVGSAMEDPVAEDGGVLGAEADARDAGQLRQERAG